MKRRVALVIALTFLAVRGSADECRVERAGSALNIHAKAVPVAQVLDRIAQQTGITVTYLGTRPSTRVSLDYQNLSPREAVQRTLEGLGLNYVLKSDRTRQAVASLTIMGT